MKIIIPIIVFLFIAFLVAFDSFVNPAGENRKDYNQSTTQVSPTPADYPTVWYQDIEYAYLIKRNITPDNLVLINNTAFRNDSKTLIEDNKCVSGMNGGFYDENNKPLGLMIISGKTISENKNSQLLNGYALIFGNSLKISRSTTTPLSDVIFGLQSGPLLYMGGKQLKLDMARDKPARRMVLGLEKNKIFFLAVFKKGAETAGPNLADLPGILTQIARIENITVDSALNMDGGSASAIYIPSGTLKETAYVGSWWCEK